LSNVVDEYMLGRRDDACVERNVLCVLNKKRRRMGKTTNLAGSSGALTLFISSLLVASASAQTSTLGPLTGAEYVAAHGALPDWNGAWSHASRSSLMFDPENYSAPPDPIGGAGFGPLPGSKLTGVPYKPEYQRQYDKTVADTAAGKAADGVALGCRPYGMPRVMAAIPSPPQIVMTPDVVVMVSDVETRLIYTDGRKHPTGDAASALWDGHSIGQWEGDTLVVDTTDMFAGSYDQTDARYSDQIHVVERIRLIDRNLLQNEMTITDPVMLTRPWKVTRQYRRATSKWPDRTYSNCGPDESIDMSEGHQRLVLPSERAADRK